jgi:hypothetical protein
MRLTVTRVVAAVGTAGLAFAGLAPLVAQAAPAPKNNNGKSSVVAYSNVAGRGGNGHGGEHSGGSHGSPGGSGNPGTAGPPPGNGQGANGNHNGNNGNHHGCHYPPSRSPQVTLTGPASTRRGSTIDLIGRVSTNGCPHDRFRVGLYSSHDGTTQWRLINSRTIHSDGRYRFKVRVGALHYYQVVLAAGGGRAVATSPIVRVATR